MTRSAPLPRRQASCVRRRLRKDSRLDWLAGVTACKAVVIEGVEVVFIVIAVGAGHGLAHPRKSWRRGGLRPRAGGRRPSCVSR